MQKISIDKDVLRKMLLEAYEAGWYGTLELKQEVVNELFEKCVAAEEKYKFVHVGAFPLSDPLHITGGAGFLVSGDIQPLTINDQPLQISPPNFEIPQPPPFQFDFGEVSIQETTIQLTRNDVNWENVGDG